jgi:thymidylate kinase
VPTPSRRIEVAVPPPDIELEAGSQVHTDHRQRDEAVWELARAIDAILSSRVIVTSKRFPAAGDLDLLCRPPERAQISGLLSNAGFIRSPRGMSGRVWTDQWARFSGWRIDMVDLNPAERWGLTPSALERLFDEAHPVSPLESIARPSPHHRLLLAARRFTRDGRLSQSSQAGIDRALQEDPDAWARASSHAGEWGCTTALRLLRDTLEQGGAPSGRGRRRAQAELLRAGRSAGWSRELLMRHAEARRPRRSHVVAISGLDGSGKSTQVQALHATLDSLGADVIVCWKPLGRSELLRRLRRAGKRLLGAPAGAAYRDSAAPARTWDPRPPTRVLRERSALATHAWAGLVAVLTAAEYRRCCLSHVGRGRVVIFDRFLLDAAAQLRFFYGSAGELTTQLRMLGWLCPTATRSYLLDVPAETAAGRKPLQYDIEELGRQAALLREEAVRLGAQRLDGCAAVEDLHEQIARDVWSGLG